MQDIAQKKLILFKQLRGFSDLRQRGSGLRVQLIPGLVHFDNVYNSKQADSYGNRRN
jgi:hypothetical protein